MRLPPTCKWSETRYSRYSTARESLVVLENKNIAMTLTSKPAAGH